ncbi:CHASE3 domain-containing protein [Pontibacter harenae]|uniref:CHASE3 domain-containing protein n=1 Tax=Pontibacter harenae TaxID=2894083 RepID=UPI001E4363D9|nr:CHASE3 domain-containing protein [Pontibacter harenae]MCC9168410.1 CHASE3 domain-containing protein [Pontibacter harenae]
MLKIYTIIRSTQEFKKFVAGFSLTFLLLILLVYIVNYNLRKENEYSRLVLHSQEEIFQIERIVSLTKDYETSARGFVITNQEIYKQPFEQAEKNLNKTFLHLVELMEDDPIQKGHLEKLHFHLTKKIAIAKFTIIASSRKRS